MEVMLDHEMTHTVSFASFVYDSRKHRIKNTDDTFTSVESIEVKTIPEQSKLQNQKHFRNTVETTETETLAQ